MKKIEFKGQKLTNIKKRTFWAQKTSWGQSLRRKKRIFGPKIGKKFENKVQKLSNFKEKENKVQKLSNLKEKRTFLAQKQAQILHLSRKMIDSTKKTSWE